MRKIKFKTSPNNFRQIWSPPLHFNKTQTGCNEFVYAGVDTPQAQAQALESQWEGMDGGVSWVKTMWLKVFLDKIDFTLKFKFISFSCRCRQLSSCFLLRKIFNCVSYDVESFWGRDEGGLDAILARLSFFIPVPVSMVEQCFSGLWVGARGEEGWDMVVLAKELSTQERGCRRKRLHQFILPFLFPFFTFSPFSGIIKLCVSLLGFTTAKKRVKI